MQFFSKEVKYKHDGHNLPITPSCPTCNSTTNMGATIELQPVWRNRPMCKPNSSISDKSQVPDSAGKLRTPTTPISCMFVANGVDTHSRARMQHTSAYLHVYESPTDPRGHVGPIKRSCAAKSSSTLHARTSYLSIN